MSKSKLVNVTASLAASEMFQVASFYGVELDDQTFPKISGSFLEWLESIQADEDVVPITSLQLVANLSLPADASIIAGAEPVIAGADSIIWVIPEPGDTGFASKLIGHVQAYSNPSSAGGVVSHNLEIYKFSERPNFAVPVDLVSTALLQKRVIAVSAGSSNGAEAWVTNVANLLSGSYNSAVLNQRISTRQSATPFAMPEQLGDGGQVKSMAFVYRRVTPVQLQATGTLWWSGKGMSASVLKKLLMFARK